jgi:asparagine synthase (glutamine-hydrolysing)
MDSLMCGIAGIFDSRRDQERMAIEVGAMADALLHRGPDDGGVASGRGWAVGARRLAIQDLSPAGAQPMRRGKLTIVYNGEVYNFGNLRRELEAKGRRFHSSSDTEVVLAAFEEWGTDAFVRFNGMFALAIVDEHRRCAWLARDRWGKKPLFVARLRDRIVFASELKAIIAVARNELTIARNALASYFRYQYVPGTQSIFGEVEKVAPASWLELDLETGRTSTETFWSLPQRDNEPPVTPEDLLDVVRGAVRRRLVADVPVGAFLSGGTDSSLVTACMKEAAPDCRTFSIGFEDPRFDESRYALAVAEHLGTDHTHRTLREREALELVASLPEVFDEPFADSSALPQLAVAKLAREDVTVALSGDGGDELFGGYLRYRAHPYLKWAARLPRTLAFLKPAVSRLPRFGRGLGLFATLTYARSPGEAYRDLVSIWKTPDLRRLMPDVDLDDGFSEAFATGKGGLVEQMMRADARTYLVDDILQKVDRATMAVSLEGRNPLLDPDVAEVAFRSVAAAEEAPGQKPLLRRSLRLLLPHRLVDRPKMGFGVPVGEWMRSELRPLVEDLVLSRSDAEYDVRVAHTACQKHLSSRAELSPQIWALLVYELWREHWSQRQRLNGGHP